MEVCEETVPLIERIPGEVCRPCTEPGGPARTDMCAALGVEQISGGCCPGSLSPVHVTIQIPQRAWVVIENLPGLMWGR